MNTSTLIKSRLLSDKVRHLALSLSRDRNISIDEALIFMVEKALMPDGGKKEILKALGRKW